MIGANDWLRCWFFTTNWSMVPKLWQQHRQIAATHWCCHQQFVDTLREVTNITQTYPRQCDRVESGNFSAHQEDVVRPEESERWVGPRKERLPIPTFDRTKSFGTVTWMPSHISHYACAHTGTCTDTWHLEKPDSVIQIQQTVMLLPRSMWTPNQQFPFTSIILWGKVDHCR